MARSYRGVNRYHPVIDLSGTYPDRMSWDLDEWVGQERQRQGQLRAPEGREWVGAGGDKHVVGIRGERVFALETGAAINWDWGSDGGADFTFDGRTIDVKGSYLVNTGALIHTRLDPVRADFYVLAVYDEARLEGWVEGYCTAELLEAAPTIAKYCPHAPGRCVLTRELQPLPDWMYEYAGVEVEPAPNDIYLAAKQATEPRPRRDIVLPPPAPLPEWRGPDAGISADDIDWSL